VAVLVHRRTTLAAIRRPPVDVDLAVGAARAGDTHGPEVVRLAPEHDPLAGNPDHTVPDVGGLLVLLVNGHPDEITVNAVAPLGHRLGHQVPGAGDRALLEVVPEREVAVHLE